MIIAHAVIGIMPVENNFSWIWLIGSIIADVDHVFVLAKNRFFSTSKIIDSIRFEDKYDIKYKTKYFHSILGAITLSIPIILIFDFRNGLLFFIAYLVHLLFDFFDYDEKQYFYPFSLKTRGWLPIFSKTEIVFTIVLAIAYFIIR